MDIILLLCELLHPCCIDDFQRPAVHLFVEALLCLEPHVPVVDSLVWSSGPQPPLPALLSTQTQFEPVFPWDGRLADNA